jgi:hypothetical protein
VAVSDLNADGILDLAVATMAGVSVLLGNGDGTFRAAANYPSGGALYDVAVSDFNHDGIPDLAVANYAKRNVSVLVGIGDGSFQAAADYP